VKAYEDVTEKINNLEVALGLKEKEPEWDYEERTTTETQTE
jgi:hypothetical protein